LYGDVGYISAIHSVLFFFYSSIELNPFKKRKEKKDKWTMWKFQLVGQGPLVEKKLFYKH